MGLDGYGIGYGLGWDLCVGLIMQCDKLWSLDALFRSVAKK